MKRIGLHLRITGSLLELLQKALQLELPFFQVFFTSRKTSNILVPRASQVRSFLSCRRLHFDNLYVHSSYYINLADTTRKHHPILMRELRVAKTLEFTHIIIHPGTVRSSDEKAAGIDATARMINYLLKRERDIQFLLENTAYGHLAIGSNIEDFHTLLTKLDQPDRIGFCIDTVHAHVSGYDIVSSQGYNTFVDFLKKNIGLERVKLIHLNETQEICGSHRDIHCCIGGADAQLGKTALKRFVCDKQLGAIPMLMELPVIAQEDEHLIIEMVNSWTMHEEK